MTLTEARARTPWLSEGFFERLIRIAKKYRAPPRALLGVLYQESGVRPDVLNRQGSGAAGLIQWMPGNVPAGYTTEQLLAMSAEEQLELVDRWFGKFIARLGGKGFTSEGLLYTTVLAPARLSPSLGEASVLYRKPDQYVPPEKEHEWAYYSNPGIDYDNSGTISVYHLTHLIRKRMAEQSFVPFDVRLADAGGGDGGYDGEPSSVVPRVAGVIAFLGAAVAVSYAAGLWGRS